jgi:hypothetical protein
MPVATRKRKPTVRPKAEIIPIDEFREWVVVLSNLLESQKVNLERTVFASEPFMESPFTNDELQRIKNKIFILSSWIKD